jgi:5'-deoxynucleotidase
MSFYAYLNRMKYIERWSLMRSTHKENIMEHSHHTAVIAHSLAVINNKVFGGNADARKTVMIALYHEISEVITGDLPTPIKYFNQNIKTAYKDLESYANDKLLNMLPEDFKPEYRQYILPDTDSLEYKLSKGADKLAAYIKCIEEIKSGNTEFDKAIISIREKIENGMPEVVYFYNNFIPSYQSTLDELK